MASLNPQVVMRSASGTKARQLVDIRHPEWSTLMGKWKEWRLVYEGGDDFVTEYTRRYSKREPKAEFDERVKLTYNPGDATTVINEVRNKMIAKLPDVVRTGDAGYVDAMKEDVDLYGSSMNSFMGLQVLPLLLAQQKRFIAVDAPPAVSRGIPATRADDAGKPYLYTVGAEEVLSWAYRPDGVLVSVLFVTTQDVTDPDTGLLMGVVPCFRFMRLLEAGETYEGVNGPGVAVRVLNEKNKDIAEPTLLKLSRIPLVEVRLVDSMLRTISRLAIGLLNLSSSDMAFLFKGNFPIYTEQFDPTVGTIKPRASAVERRDRPASQPAEDPQTRHSNDDELPVGVNKGIRYRKGTERPGFIGPAPSNLQVSMEKQRAISENIRLLATLALASMSTKALEQSGKSKELDRDSLEAGLAYIGSELQTAERGVALLWHEFLGMPNADYSVNYPSNWRVLSTDERIALAGQWKTVKGAVRSETYQKEVEKLVAGIVISPNVDEATMTKVNQEVDDAEWFDDSPERAEQLGKDVTNQILDTEKAAELRGFGAETARAVKDGEEDLAEALSTGALPTAAQGQPVVKPVPAEDDDEDGEGEGVTPAGQPGAGQAAG